MKTTIEQCSGVCVSSRKRSRDFAFRRHPLALASIAAFTVAMHAAPARADCVAVGPAATYVTGPTSGMCLTWAPGSGGTLTIDSGASLTGIADAITISGFGIGAVLTNNGLIDGTSYGIINDAMIGTVSNNAGATLVGESMSGLSNQVGGVMSSLTNAAGGTISGGSSGVANLGTIVSVVNSGLISGAVGVENGASGYIGTLTNTGTISGNGGLGVGLHDFLGSIGTVDNEVQGLIFGSVDGVHVEGTIGALTNEGTITGGTTGIAVGDAMAALGTITNSGMISGGQYGIVGSNLTIANSGTISGGTDAIDFTGGSNTLTLQNGALVNGAIELGSGARATIGAADAGLTLGSAIKLDSTDAALTLDSTRTLTVAGAISGTGSVTVAGAGTLTMAGANRYSGTTTVAGGTLRLTGDTSGMTGNIVDNGALVFGQSADSSYGGAISGTGSVTQSGTGTLTMAGANTYSGTTTVASGTLRLSGDTSGLTGNIVDNGALVFAQSANSSYGGAISGTGSVTQSGTGTLTLTGTNGYSGATTIASGATLALSRAGSVAASSGVTNDGTFDISGTNGTSIASLSGSGNVMLGNGTLTLTNASGIFGGTISGTGGLTIAGGTETLTNVNTYTGTTLIENGATLVLAEANDIALGNVVDQGTLSISGSIGALSGNGTISVGSAGLVLTGAGGTFGGVIGGAGGLTLSAGSQTLTGANTYTGMTTIDSGSTLALVGAGSVAQSAGVADAGTFDISGTTNGASIAGLSGSGTVNLGSQTLALNGGGSFSGTLTGSGKLQINNGNLLLNGNSGGFTGTTEVAGGLLDVGYASASAVLGGNVTVDPGATLSGHGTIGGSVANHGVLALGGPNVPALAATASDASDAGPARSPQWIANAAVSPAAISTLSVSGNYTQASGATLAVEVNPTTASQLLVRGSATLGGTLAITYDPGTYTAKTYTLVSAGSVNGTFAATTSTGASNLGTLVPSLVYDANAVDLVLAASAPLVVAPTGTSIYSAVGTSAILGARAQGSTLLDRLGEASAATAAQPYGWINATGSQTKVGSSNGEPGFQTDRYGFLAGLDGRLGENLVGIAVGYDHANIDESDTGNSGTTDTLRASVYASRMVGPLNIAATFGAGLDFLSQKRPFSAQRTAEGDHLGQDVNFGTQASLPLALGGVTVTPRVGLRYAYFHANGFGESGADGQDLGVGTDNVHSLQPFVGVTLDKAFGDPVNPLNAQLRLGYAYELLDASRTLSVTAQDGTVFAAPGANLPRGYLSAGASVTLHPKKHLDVSLSYDTVINTSHASAQQGSVRVGYRF
jgi:autotransporter-associated beta strand protein